MSRFRDQVAVPYSCHGRREIQSDGVIIIKMTDHTQFLRRRKILQLLNPVCHSGDELKCLFVTGYHIEIADIVDEGKVENYQRSDRNTAPGEKTAFSVRGSRLIKCACAIGFALLWQGGSRFVHIIVEEDWQHIDQAKSCIHKHIVPDIRGQKIDHGAGKRYADKTKQEHQKRNRPLIQPVFPYLPYQQAEKEKKQADIQYFIKIDLSQRAEKEIGKIDNTVFDGC